MQELLLPLVESLIASYTGPSLHRTKIIGVQHILETTHSMFRSLYKIGLKPENISIIGKCYSTCTEVYHEMVSDGIDVSPGSLAYSSHRSYDEQFSYEVRKFLESQNEDLHSDKYDSIIILDDGGKCISFLSQHALPDVLTIAIEQTTSGYEAIRLQALPFPVINVARSPLKLNLESPMIAQAAAERLYLSLRQRNLSPSKALIIGGGAIGQAMYQRLATELDVSIFDSNKERNSAMTNDLAGIICEFPLIIGCTGKISIPHSLHPSLSSGTTLVSVSSSDREFDAAYLRRSLPENEDCLRDLEINNILLVKSGFPVNFDGHRENIEPHLIQLTIALITAGILQARQSETNLPLGIIPVNSVLENKIEKEFLNIRDATVTYSI